MFRCIESAHLTYTQTCSRTNARLRTTHVMGRGSELLPGKLVTTIIEHSIRQHPNYLPLLGKKGFGSIFMFSTVLGRRLMHAQIPISSINIEPILNLSIEKSQSNYVLIIKLKNDNVSEKIVPLILWGPKRKSIRINRRRGPKIKNNFNGILSSFSSNPWYDSALEWAS
jgi:hypothetical protein